MQVWSKEGVLHFERKLTKKPAQWSLMGKSLIFKEDVDSDHIYIVKLRRFKKCTLFRFTMPSKVDNKWWHSADLQLGFINGHFVAATNECIYYIDVNAYFSKKLTGQHVDSEAIFELEV